MEEKIQIASTLRSQIETLFEKYIDLMGRDDAQDMIDDLSHGYIEEHLGVEKN